MSHKWITSVGPKTSDSLSVATAIENFTSLTGITKVLFKMIYNELSPQELENMKVMFNEIDKDGKGYIDLEGVAKYLGRSLSRSKSLKGMAKEFQKSQANRKTSMRMQSPYATPTAKKLKSPSSKQSLSSRNFATIVASPRM